MKTFDVLNIELNNKNLIEASAGTGKTYSIGILMLRLLLEKDIRIEQILMVTFTNAAVAELEIRTRKFLREAFNVVSLPREDYDATIKFIVERAIQTKGKEEVEKILSEAILFLDETAIFTIHSFCQLTLSEFAFETKQLFNTELVESQDVLREDAVNDFWRKKITVLDNLVLEVLFDNNFSRELLIDFSKDILNGKKLVVTNQIDTNNILKDIKDYKQRAFHFERKLKDKINENWNSIISNIKMKGTRLYKAAHRDNQEDFFTELLVTYKKPSATVLQTLTFLFSDIDDYINANEEYNLFKKDIFIYYLSLAESFIKTEVENKKNRNQVFSFHDLIGKLHLELIHNNNTNLQTKLCSKYKAVFIDEFQDTDHLQYEIFKKAFVDNCDSTVFFIGDPKQSIYSWRGADLRTYIKAQEDIGDNKFTMRNNFRSVSPLIDAMNEFFPAGESCRTDFVSKSDPFCSEHIKYEKVNVGNENLPILYNQNGIANSFDIVDHGKGNKPDILDASAREIIDLLENHYLEKDGEKRKVKPSDIRILVRSRKDSKEIKDVLVKYNIPTVIVDDTKVVETDEARELFYVLIAIESPNKNNVSRALLTSFLGFDSESIKHEDIDLHKSHFSELFEIWKKSGVFSTIINLLSNYNTREKLIDNPYGNRIYTNLMQITEILNEKELYSNYSPIMLLEWFKKVREGMNALNEYEQRIESDEEAVEILTIHKSKGLSFNIVVLPWLNLSKRKIGESDSISLLKDDGFYISYYKTEDELQMYNMQSEQENRRLLYVAITRAVYKCIIHYKNKLGALESFIPNLDSNSSVLVKREALPIIDYKYNSTNESNIERNPLDFHGKLDDSWRLTSYSALDAHESSYSYKKEEKVDNTDEYDFFIFNQLTKGAQTGNILHNILEKLDFIDNTYWENSIKKQLQLYGRETDETIVKNYKTLLNHTLNANLNEGLKLKNIEFDKRFNELEFYFSFDNWNPQKIKKLIPKINIYDKNIEGIMHGYIDLLFEYKGKYYILDWKSNHLGYSIDDYDMTKVEEAMTNNNYHLQYYVYTIAVKRFLEKRLPDFDYNKHFGGAFYLFLRGIRAENNTGIFFNRPQKELIERLEEILE